MENNKKKNNYFIRLIFVLFIIYLCVYAIGENGFIERKYSNKTLYTEEQIKKFEDDVLNGKEIDINKYLSNEESDYSNSISKLGENMSNLINVGADKLDKLLSSVFQFLFE